ncbi:hypothetical protein RchiOBHm_Chr3g0450431 [Rosa chinensis]|uniref:Uncharacterized protein n=1 Tax=Rosa chinensis TaxID=74649 RepID=A0A2P6R5R2_ROSCH|nr:hypothetical protein RchiOBHm_Chr3g0450431 [Rosa chinensis]
MRIMSWYLQECKPGGEFALITVSSTPLHVRITSLSHSLTKCWSDSQDMPTIVSWTDTQDTIRSQSIPWTKRRLHLRVPLARLLTVGCRLVCVMHRRLFNVA